MPVFEIVTHVVFENVFHIEAETLEEAERIATDGGCAQGMNFLQRFIGALVTNVRLVRRSDVEKRKRKWTDRGYF